MKTLEYMGETYPAKNIVCPRCDGEGTHTNPSIDGNGLTASDINELMFDDDSFLDNYFGGVYDVSCEQCNGSRIVLALDEDRATEAQIQRYYDDKQEERNWEAERQAELRAGC